MDFNDSITQIKGIGPKSAALFAKLDVFNVGQLISYYPRDYEEYKLPADIGSVAEGQVVTIEGAVSRVETNRGRKFPVTTCFCNDTTGAIKLIWFNQPYMQKMLRPGFRYLFRGTVKRDYAAYVIEQPKLYTRDDYRKLMSSLQPIYPLTAGLTSNAIQKAVKSVLGQLEFEKESLSAAFRKEHDLIKHAEAVESIHFPNSGEDASKARRRLAFEEFVEFLSAVRKMKEERVLDKNGYVINDFNKCEELISSLPFELTKGQLSAWNEIKRDISGDYLMMRLVEGDVGSGKTIVAMLAMLAASSSGYQSALMVPTEVLAKQHFIEFSERLEQFGVKCALLVGSMTAAEKKSVYAKIASKEADIIIGTHALIQEKVEYSNLGLVVVDEQHRFGVRQREALQNKGLKPHILSMSATPIPRSLALILYGDTDLSVIKEIPAERKPIKNCVVASDKRRTSFNFIKNEVANGHQAYIICPMVEESEEMDGENVVRYVEDFREAMLELRAECLHGKMKPKEKNEIMERFSRGEIDVLISTTVVEVGVNVKNATVMMIENAERFGLAQLHQLRGRVGRGQWQSYCIFVKGADSQEIDERLNILVKHNNGFEVAEEDLKHRGPGDVLGVRQAGEQSFALADIYADADLLALASDYINGMV